MKDDEYKIQEDKDKLNELLDGLGRFMKHVDAREKKRGCMSCIDACIGMLFQMRSILILDSGPAPDMIEPLDKIMVMCADVLHIAMKEEDEDGKE